MTGISTSTSSHAPQTFLIGLSLAEQIIARIASLARVGGGSVSAREARRRRITARVLCAAGVNHVAAQLAAETAQSAVELLGAKRLSELFDALGTLECECQRISRGRLPRR